MSITVLIAGNLDYTHIRTLFHLFYRLKLLNAPVIITGTSRISSYMCL